MEKFEKKMTPNKMINSCDCNLALSMPSVKATEFLVQFRPISKKRGRRRRRG